MSKHRWRGIAWSLGVHQNLVLWNSYSNTDRMRSVFDNIKIYWNLNLHHIG